MSRCLGVFDSGLGGLTVLKALLERCACDRIVYFGDTARVPYGTQARETIVRYSMQDMRFLLSKGVDEVVIACGTVTANAMDVLRERFPLPITGIVDDGARAAAEATVSGNIGIIATEATIRSGAFARAIRQARPDAVLTEAACPLLVQLVEYGFTEPGNPVTAAACEQYLAPLRSAGVDTLVLGCTHFPVVEPAIARCMGETVRLVDSGRALAERLAAAEPRTPELEFYVSGDPARFDRGRDLFMGGRYPGAAELVDITRF